MIVETLEAELARLELHPVNLGVAAKDDRLVTLQGSLLRYWTVPAILDGRWLLKILQGLPNAAGPEAVMNALSSAQASKLREEKAAQTKTELKLFDPTPHDPGDSDR